MAKKLYTTMSKHICPNCNNVVKTKIDSDALDLFLFVLFPIGILVWLCKLISNFFGEKTSTGEEIIICPYCGKKLGLSGNAQFCSTRIILSKSEILDLISPSINYLCQIGINYRQYEVNNKDLKDVLYLRFVNNANNKLCDVFIASIFELTIGFKGETYSYTDEKLIKLVANAIG